MCDELKCQYCGKVFHIVNNGSYGGKAYHEKICKLNPNRVQLDYSSFNLKKKEGGWECQTCHAIFSTKRELCDHLSDNQDHRVDNRRSHTNWQCEYCNSEFKTQRLLYEHYKTCEEKSNLPHDSRGHVISQKVLDGRSKRLDTINKAIESGDLVYIGHPHSEESKRKLSIARHNNIVNGIGSTWTNSSIKRSYAEQYFFDCFTNSGLSFGNNVWVGKYCLDFVVGNNYFEVDGEQHYTEDGIIKDSLRTEYLKNLGMNLIGRCRWSAFQAMSDNDRFLYVKDVIVKLQSGEYVNPLQFINNTKHNTNKHNNIKIRILKNIIRDLVKLKSLMNKLDSIESGRIRSDGCIYSRMFSDSQWETFRDLILNSGVDLTKFGWVGKVVDLTGLSKKIIRKTVRRFNIECFERSHK